MFPIFDHIDCLIAADYYEESNQNLLSEAMKQLNRPCLEYWGCEKYIRGDIRHRWSRSRTISGRVLFWSINSKYRLVSSSMSKTCSRFNSFSRSNNVSYSRSR